MTQIKVELQEHMGSDKSIANAAWTSSLDYQKKQTRTDEDIKRVVNMLADSKHSVPFESVIFKFWMKIPIQTDRQIMTHRIGSHSGMSGRYRTMPNDYLDLPEEIDNTIKLLESKYDWFQEYYDICEWSNSRYNDLIKEAKQAEKDGKITNKEFKRLREFYRGVLPQNNMTERVSIFNLRSFANFYKLRSSEHAQPEIQEVAKLMMEAVEKSGVCPIAIEALKRNNWNI